MKTIKKANVKSNAHRIESKAADELGIGIYMFIRKDLDTLIEKVVCAVQFKDRKGKMSQTEDIAINGLDIGAFERYDVKLKKDVNVTEMRQGKEVKTTTTCVKELKKFLRNELNKLPVRMYYDKGYGWSYDKATGSLRFDGSSIAGIGDLILDEHEHHLTRKGDQVMTIEICNEVMHDRINTQFLLATSLAAPIFGALDLKSLIVNVFGRSSQGKTTILKLCMSLWSNPEDENLATTWFNTEGAICSSLNNLEGVPYLIDDTSQGNIKNFTSVVYNIEEGKSKGRLNKLFKLDSVAKWHTCILSGSETSMYNRTDEDKKGILRRLVEVEVVEGDLIRDEKQSRNVDEVRKENYGDVGISFVRKLFENNLIDKQLEKLRKILVKEQNSLQSIIGSNGIARGLAEKLAVVLLAAKLGKKYLGLNFDIDDLTEYTQMLILKSEKKVEEVMVDKKDYETCYKEVCQFVEEKLDERYIAEHVYHIPVPYFNVLEKKYGYDYKELRSLFAKQGICNFNNPSDVKDLDNTAKIAKEVGGVKISAKVITVTKMM